MTNKIDKGQGVYIPQEAVVRSNEKKKSHRALRQLPIYRDASNLKFIIASLYGSVPRKYTKYMEKKKPDDIDIEHMMQTLNSYNGFTRRKQTYNIRKKCLELIGKGFWRYFYLKGRFIDDGNRKKRLWNIVKPRKNIKPREQ